MVVQPRNVLILQMLSNHFEGFGSIDHGCRHDSETRLQKQRGSNLHHSCGDGHQGMEQLFKFSLDMCRFAYTSYAKTLSELRTYVRGSPMDKFVAFLVKMQTINDTITDFTPPLPDRYHPIAIKTF